MYVPVPSFDSAGAAWYGSHHGRQGPHTASCWQQLHEQTSHSTLHERSSDHARDIVQRTPCIIHHISQTQFSIHETSCTKHHGAVWQLHVACMKQRMLKMEETACLEPGSKPEFYRKVGILHGMLPRYISPTVEDAPVRA